MVWRGTFFGSIAALVFLYYTFLITNGSFDLFSGARATNQPINLGLAFNNMLSHLLRGDFAVDADIITSEAFLRDGKTYTYFGVAPIVLMGSTRME